VLDTDTAERSCSAPGVGASRATGDGPCHGKAAHAGALGNCGVPPAVDQTATSSKLVALVEQVEAGTKELERQVDELRPRFQQAMQKGRENMGRMQSHIERVAKSVETIEGATTLGACDLDA
jgi:hypothetical protein